MAFYARRLKQERVTRTFSAIAAVMIVLLQFLTIAAPPAPTNASSTNDIYRGGFVSRIDMLNRYDESAELRNLYTTYFGITRADIANAQVANISSKDHSLKSVGRVQHTDSDEEILTGGYVYFGRPLSVWDTGANVSAGSSYQVLQGTTAKGAYWAIIFKCGNVVYKKLPVSTVTTPPKTAQVVTRTPPSTGCLPADEASSYITSFTRGTGTISTYKGLPLCKGASLVLESFSIPDTWDGHGFNASSIPQTKFNTTSVTLPSNQANLRVTMNVSVPPACKPTQLDFYFPPAFQTINGLHTDDAQYIGGKIFAGSGNCSTPTPTATATPKITPKVTPKPTASALACSKLTAATTSGPAPLTTSFSGSGTSTGQSISEYQFDFGDQHSISSTSPSAGHTYTTAGSYTATLTLTSSTGATTAVTDQCSVAITVTAPPATYVKNKSAQNLTQNRDATLAPAQPLDQIRYTITTKNAGGVLGEYTVMEHLEDVLEYADVTDTGGANLTNGVLTWPAGSIAPGATLLKTFTVTLKDPLPATPIGVSDRFSYDLRLDNIYGTQVSISVAAPLAKQVEGASTSLPQTGTATSTLIILAISFLALFFYFRNRQLITEIKILRGSYQGGLS